MATPSVAAGRRPFGEGVLEPSRLARLVVAAAIPLAILVGVVTSLAPLLGVAAGLIVVGAVWLIALGRRVETIFLVTLGLLATGYALLGRGFAHVGVPPLYVGEIGLVLAIVVSVMAFRPEKVSWLHIPLVAFMVWGAIRTIPYISLYGIDALRDGVSWAYALFAIAVSFAIEPKHIRLIIRWYERLIPVFLLWVPVAILITLGHYEAAPDDVPLITLKTGDAGVNLAGIAAFMFLGLGTSGAWTGVKEALYWVPWLAIVGLVSIISRGALVATGAALASVLFVRQSIRWVRVALVAAVLVATIGLLEPEVDLGIARRLSIDQLFQNVTSVFADQADPILQGTKEWRLRWWDDIIGYTIDGQYFWTGKGFGINLADDDGFQVEDGALRAPHNGHLQILARTGVPGLVLWIFFQLAFAASLLLASVRARRAGRLGWVAVLGWIFVYWLAAILNMTFDVYLEGPQGGIPFWSAIGLGIAAIRLSRVAPPEDDPTRPETTASEAAEAPAG